MTSRPNANYNLSKPENEATADGNLNFYYDRERRLEKAPQVVKDLYKEEKFKKFSLFRSLTADKPRTALFVTILILCVVILVLSVLGFFNDAYSLDGNKLQISAIGYEGTAIVVIKKTVSNIAPSYSGAVDIAVSPAAQDEDEQYQVFYHRIFFTVEPKEEYRFVIPFDSQEVGMVLQTDKNSLKIIIKVD